MGAQRRLGAVAASIAVVVAMAAAPASGAIGSAGTRATHGLSASEIARLRHGTPQRSIIIFRNQYRTLVAKGAASSARNTSEDVDQAAVRSELGVLHATNVHSFHTVNAVGATISAAEIAHLRANPAVQAVVPDLMIKAPTVPTADDHDAAAAAAPNVKAAAHRNDATPADAQQICPSDPSQPLLEPEALQLMNAASQPGSGVPAAQDIVDGTGVKVAFMADGLDINNPDFIRSDSAHVFADYQDFSGSGLNAPTPGAQAFGDASAIAAQGRESYDLSNFVNPAHPLPPGCNINIRGVAPGATLYGLKVFGENDLAFASSFLQAIDYAIDVDQVDVINQSFTQNVYPDAANDPIALADQAAVAAGVTVVASSGDAGATNTIAAPSDAPGVIGVGATTSLRLYQQTGSSGTQFSNGGWLSDNLSAVSSAGFTQFGPHTVDVVAPGDLGWTLCTADLSLYQDCSNFAGAPSPIQDFGGTDQSAPLTSGTAALVIQAYESTHGGVRPTPALVKQIIVDSATDLHLPAEEQGAGLVNALKAVQLAESIHDTNGSPAAVGSNLLVDQTRLNVVGPAGKTRAFPVKITNTGTTTQTVTPSPEALDPTLLSSQSGTLAANPSTDPTFIDGTGVPSSYQLHTFPVPSGADVLDASITWNAQSQPNAILQVTLFDPLGRMAAYSLPQGGGGYGRVEVHDPSAGDWTAVFWQHQSANDYTGPFQYAVTTQQFTTTGTVLPASHTLAPGATASFRVTVPLPAQAGDSGIDLRIGTGQADDGSIPITVRALVSLDATNSPRHGSFSGVLTGGNGHLGFGAVTKTFQFDVGVKKSLLDVSVALADPGYTVYGVLVDPNLEPLDVQSTLDVSFNAGQNMQFFERKPALGRWTLVLAMQLGNPGLQLQEPFTGTATLESAPVVATGVPDKVNKVLHAGTPTTATIQVTNTGSTENQFFVNPRLDTTSQMPVVALAPTTIALPATNAQPAFLIPPDSTNLTMSASASLPIQMDMFPELGSPDIEASSTGISVSATLTAPEVAPGAWFAGPTEVGPFTGPAPAGTVTFGATVVANDFDTTVTSSTGDLWARAVGLSSAGTPLDLLPGQSGTITVTFAPTGTPGTVVKGFLALDAQNSSTLTGDELSNIPYQYTIG